MIQPVQMYSQIHYGQCNQLKILQRGLLMFIEQCGKYCAFENHQIISRPAVAHTILISSTQAFSRQQRCLSGQEYIQLFQMTRFQFQILI